MAELDKDLEQELIDLAGKYEEESEKPYLAVIRAVSQIRAMVKGDAAPGDWFDPVEWQWRPMQESSQYNENIKPRYNYKINFMQTWWQILQGAIQTVGIPGATFRPQNSQQAEDRDAADKGKQIIEYEQTVTDFRDLMLGIYKLFATDGICLAYTRYVKDAIQFGTTVIPRDITESQITREAGYQCFEPGCDQFTPSGQTLPDQATETMACPHCQKPFHSENFMPEQVENVVVGQEQYEIPNGQEITDLYGALEGFLPWWANDLAHSPYCRIRTEVPIEEVIAAFSNLKTPGKSAEIESKLFGQTSDEGKLDRQARQYARSSVAGRVAGGTPFTTYSRWWFRPQCFYRIIHKEHRDKLLEKFPEGVFFQLAGSSSPIFLDAYPEKMESKLGLMRPMKGDGMYTPAILQSGVPIQLSVQDAWNMSLEGMLFAGFSQGYGDAAVFSGEGANSSRVEPGTIKLLDVPGEKTMRDSFFEMKSQDISQSAQAFLAQGQPMGEFLLGTPPSIQGVAMKNVRTTSGQAQARSQALQRQAPAYGAIKIGLAGIQGRMVNEFLQNRSAETYFEVVTDSGDFEQRKIQLDPERGRVVAYPEVSESIPQTWAQRADAINGLMESQNPTVQSWLAYPKNARAAFDAMGIPELVVPGKEMQEKYERIIELLLQGEPEKQTVPNEADPMSPPTTVTVPSLPFDPLFDDAQIALTVLREWAATPKGMQIVASESPGFANLRAYAEQIWGELNATVAPTAPPENQQMGAA